MSLSISCLSLKLTIFLIPFTKVNVVCDMFCDFCVLSLADFTLAWL